jgi:hypothetical protein
MRVRPHLRFLFRSGPVVSLGLQLYNLPPPPGPSPLPFLSSPASFSPLINTISPPRLYMRDFEKVRSSLSRLSPPHSPQISHLAALPNACIPPLLSLTYGKYIPSHVTQSSHSPVDLTCPVFMRAAIFIKPPILHYPLPSQLQPQITLILAL